MDSWRLVSLVRCVSGRNVAAQTSDGAIRELAAAPAGLTLLDIVRAWDAHEPALRRYDPNSAEKIEGVGIGAPLTYPSNLICIGANYRRHLQEMGIEPAANSRPFIFLKPPTSSIIGTGDDIIIDRESDNVDWEAEVAVVIRKGGRDIQPSDALAHVAGYTLANDVSARGRFHNTEAAHAAFEYDWLAVKGLDTFCPMGPGVLPYWFVEDPSAISFDLRVNGAVKQDGSTAEMILDIAHCIAAASRLMTLNPGDVIATGTPQGVGGGRGDYLKHGDEVVLSSPLLGVLKNRVRVRNT